MQHRPRKRFGQHFLHDRRVIEFILSRIPAGAPESLIEIGPGRGALTGPLLDHNGRLTVIEIDRDLAAALADHFPADKLRVIVADVLECDFGTLFPGQKIRLAGNLPYNISTPLLFHLISQSGNIAEMLFMMQREVVDRICAAPGSKTYGRLSVMVQAGCRTERLLDIGRGAFNPPPKVESSLVRLVPDNRHRERIASQAAFRMVVREAFSQRRKTLKNALGQWLDATTLERLGIDPAARAEVLSVAEFINIANAVDNIEH